MFNWYPSLQGVTAPALVTLLGKWAPPLERSQMATIALSGALLGNVVTFPLSGVLCQCGFAGGWPSVFYVSGEEVGGGGKVTRPCTDASCMFRHTLPASLCSQQLQ